MKKSLRGKLLIHHVELRRWSKFVGRDDSLTIIWLGHSVGLCKFGQVRVVGLYLANNPRWAPCTNPNEITEKYTSLGDTHTLIILLIRLMVSNRMIFLSPSCHKKTLPSTSGRGGSEYSTKYLKYFGLLLRFHDDGVGTPACLHILKSLIHLWLKKNLTHTYI